MKRQTKILLCLLAVLVGAGLLIAAFFLAGGAFRPSPEEEPPAKDADSSSGGYSLPPEVLVDRGIFSGYWWSDETSFFCIEEGKYRLYQLNSEKNAFVLSAEYTVSIVGKYLFLYPENRDEMPLGMEYTLEEDGKILRLRSTDEGKTSDISVFTAGEKPALPMLEGEGSR